MIKKLILLSLILFSTKCFSQNWLPLKNGIGCDSFGGGGTAINNFFVDENESKIYLSGNFFFTENGNYENCDTITSGAAVWDGYGFTNLDGSKYFQQGNEIVVYKNKIYESAPIFDYQITECFFYRWNGVDWDTIAGAPDSRVVFSKEINGELWLGGWFDNCGGQSSPMLGKFDGENFQPLNTNFNLLLDPYIGAMDFLNDTLYVAGDFANLGGNSDDSISTIAKFYNNRLYGIKPFLSTVSNINANCMVNYKNELYLGGYLKIDGVDSLFYLLRYDGKKFSNVGNMKFNERILGLKVYNNELYILGMFNKLGDQEAHQLVKWDGEKYTVLNTDTIKTKYGVPAIDASLSVTCIDVMNDTLYLAGSFFTIGNDTMRCIAKLNRALSDPIPPPAENSLTLYPNPSSNEVTISYTLNSQQNVSFSIYDIGGRLVKKIEKGNKALGKYLLEKVDVSQLAAGIYFVAMQTEKGRMVKKLVKE